MRLLAFTLFGIVITTTVLPCNARGNRWKQDVIMEPIVDGANEDPNPVPPTTVPIPQRDVDRIKTGWVPYTQSAYCIDGLVDWKCRTCKGDTYGTKNVTTFGDFQNSVFGFVAINHRRQHIVVSFRGSRNMENWIDDLLIAKPDCPFPGAPEGAKIHLGFLNSWNLVREEVLTALIPLNDLYPFYEVWITGHSLGGALATLAAVDLRQTLNESLPAFRIKLLTFGQPRVGNAKWAEWVDSLSFDYSMRVVNQDDLTPHLPPSFAGFKHCPDEIWIADEIGTTLLCSDDNGDFTTTPSPSFVSLEENKDCANRIKWRYNVSRHTWIWQMQVGHKACGDLTSTSIANFL
ncbi:Alpha/Beta hydrolase protein [Chytridium lagenaria]|nr:Alpha/Beta hydrolase protein [Chytridium lagenaria]